MNKQLSKEQREILIKTANYMIDRSDTSDYSENIRQVAMLALSCLDQEPVARHQYDSKALELARKVMAIMYGPMPIGGSVQLQAQVQCLFVEALQYAAPPAPVVPDAWIPCSQRMPKKNDWVLIFIDFNCAHVPPSIHDAQFTGSTFRRGDATIKVFPHDDGIGVTHWQPLPAPPKD